MGAWGESAFENDTAGDWVNELIASDRYQMIGVALDKAAYNVVDADDGSIAIAAAELVAAGRGWPMRRLPTEIKDWIDRFDYQPSGGARSLALDALKSILKESELAELWNGQPGWRKGVENLIERLKRAPKPRSEKAKAKRTMPTDLAAAIKRLTSQHGYIERTKAGNVRDARLEENDEATLVACLPFLSTAKVLWIGSASIGGKAPDTIGDAALESLDRFTNLEELRLDKTRITNVTLCKLARLTKLKRLGLAETKVSDVGLENLAGLTALEELALDGTAISAAGMAHLKSLVRLRKLTLAKTKVDDEGLAVLARMKSLSWLDLRDTRITGTGLRHLAGLNDLWILELAGTKVDDEGLKHLGEKKKLARLTLSGRQITDNAMKSIGKLTGLGALVIEKTAVTDETLRILAKLPNLEVLDAKGSKITETGAQGLRDAKPGLRVNDRSTKPAAPA